MIKNFSSNNLIDYHRVRKLAIKYKPKLIIAGYSAYSKIINWKIFKYTSDGSFRSRDNCFVNLTWKIELADELLWLTRAACVRVLWMTGDDDWRCGDSSEWVNNPVQLPAGSYPGPGTLECEPGPVPWWPLAAPCVYWGGPGTRRLSLIKGQWWLLIWD